MGEKFEFTVVHAPSPDQGCADLLGLEEGATLATTIREFEGGTTCSAATGDVTTSTGTWTVSHGLGGTAASFGAYYSVTANNCHFDGQIYIISAHTSRLDVDVLQDGDPSCPYECQGEWYLTESN